MTKMSRPLSRPQVRECNVVYTNTSRDRAARYSEVAIYFKLFTICLNISVFDETNTSMHFAGHSMDIQPDTFVQTQQ
jgi:hypothetical protein